MIHVVTGESAAAALKNAFHKINDQFIEMPMDFSVGPVTAIHEQRGLAARVDWVASSFNPLNNITDAQLSTYRCSLENLRQMNDGECLTIWTCDNASEQIGLRLACFLLAGKQVELSIVNTHHAMNDYSKDHEVQQIIRHTGECNGKQLVHFYKHSSGSITEEMRTAFELDAENLLLSTGLLRSWNHDRILEEEETRYDAFIIDCIKDNSAEEPNTEYMDAIRIIGEIFGRSEQPISDVWIDYRIRSLIQTGQLAYRGKLHSMRSYQIKAMY